MYTRIFEYPRKGPYFLLLCVLFTQSCATAAPKPSQEEALSSATQPASILQAPGFKAFKQTLKHIVSERSPDTQKPQHFFVSKYPKDETLTYMFWQEQNLLWIMNIGSTDEESWLGVRYPSGGQLIDLKASVVNTADEVGGSSFLVTKDWAAARLFDAVVLGDSIVITP